MAEEIGIVMSLYDKVSPTLKSIAGNSAVFDKSLEDLEKSLKAYDEAQNTLVSRAADLKKAMAENTVKVREAQKEYRKLKDETSKGALDDAIEEQEKLKNALKETESAIKANNDGYKELYRTATEAASAAKKEENRMAASTNQGILSKLGQAGAISMVGDVGAQWANAIVASQFGQEIGSYFGGTLSGAAAGAAIGSMLIPIPGVGTAIGAGVGGLVGLAGSAADAYTNRQQAFTDYYNTLYDETGTAMGERLTGGSTTSAQRQLDALAFGTLISGEGGADAFLKDLSEMAAMTPFEYGDLTAMSKQLAIGFGDDPSRILSLMQGIGDAGATVGASANDMQWLATALSRMQSTDLAQLGEINMFQDRGIDVIGMLADHYGIGEADVRSMITGGDLGGREAVRIIEEGMKTMYSGAMDEMSKTFSGLSSTLTDTMDNINAAMGSGYNAVRSEGMTEEIAAYGGSLGSAMEEAYTAIGAGKAALENQAEAYTRDALSAVLEGKDLSQEWSDSNVKALADLTDQYKEAMDAYKAGDEAAGFELESIIQQAEAIAKAQSETSDLYKSAMETEEDTLTALQNNTTALEAATAAYEIAQTKTIGYTGNIGTGVQTDYTPTAAAIYQGDTSPTSIIPSYAAAAGGVSTNKQTINVSVTGNTFGAGMDMDEMANKLANEISLKVKAGAR